jgi:hypothetical protein
LTVVIFIILICFFGGWATRRDGGDEYEYQPLAPDQTTLASSVAEFRSHLRNAGSAKQ